MTDVTYDKAIAAPAPAAVAKPARKSYWQRAFDAMVEARMRQAERLVREYQELAKR
jgi:hypothetical protein